jgi:uncharacterized protein (DUF2062 family)
MADSDTQTSRVSPDKLVTEIEATRADLARTIDDITDRLSPKNASRRAVQQAKDRLAQIDPKIGATAAAVAVGIGVAAVLLWRRKHDC